MLLAVEVEHAYGVKVPRALRYPLLFLASIVDDATIARLLPSLPLRCLCLWMSLLAALKNLAVKISCHLHAVWLSIITHSTVPVSIKSHTMASLAMSANVLFIYLPLCSHALYDIYLTTVFSVILARESGPSVVNCMSNWSALCMCGRKHTVLVEVRQSLPPTDVGVGGTSYAVCDTSNSYSPATYTSHYM
ncbi:hypothetical protein BDR04DRAFT_119237 [Suillus decipiens]|nr:hypothetical protein BDR04DRAFT_119237 [Suillus decipiens]